MDNGHYELVFTLYTAVSHATMIPVFHVCTTPVFHHPAVFKHGLGCLYLFLTISIIQHQRISLHIHNSYSVSLIPAFRHLQYGKAGREPGIFSHMSMT